MEVHHHTHSARKKWSHYFWEFLMLFLAVFCGFLAEYQLEHKIERDRAKQLAGSLYNDIKEDTADLNRVLTVFATPKINHIDTLLGILQKKYRQNDTAFSVHASWLVFINNFFRNNGTYEQLKNSGSLRYFGQELIDILHEYENICGRIKLREEAEREKIEQRTIPFVQQIINYEFVHALLHGLRYPDRVYVKLDDQDTIDQMVNKTIEVKTVTMRRRILYNELKQKAVEILAVLKAKYHLE
ncbi:MAG TPA: hypothetical protein VF144_05445 [Chitinophagaceae bacterium]